MVRGRERFEDAPLMALKMEKRPQAKELGQPLGGGKGQENVFSPTAPTKECTPRF